MIGQTLGSYRLDAELGTGGMGTVYAATIVDRCPGLDSGTRVALKVIHPHLLEQPGFFRRFLREADIGTAVSHPNVVHTHLADAIGRHHFLVMEYVEGQTLRELLDELGRVPEELCRHVGREIASGLAAVHGAGAVHRDLKPSNVLITAAHEVKVMDLGVARLADEAVRLSQSGTFVGSVEYAAPEQFRSGGGDLRADLHALGVLLYELSSGRHPYRGDDFRAVMRAILDASPRRVGDVNPQLSPFFEEVVHTLMAKEPESRFQSAAEVIAALDSCEASDWWQHRETIIRRESRRPLRRIRIPRETAVYGRERELGRLRSSFDRAASGDGQVALIGGEAGIGKSRLVDELITRLRSDGADVDFLYGSYAPTGAATAQGAFSTAFRERFGAGGVAQYLTETPLLVPAFDALLRGDAAPQGAEPLTRDSMGTCFVHAARALATKRTTVVLIDDLHFAPQESRGLFTALALAVPGHRLLLIGTARPGLPESWVAHLTRPEHVSHLPLERLGGKDVATLLVDAFRSERLADELGFRIIQKSDGNPFFVFEIIRGLREGQFISQNDDGTWMSTRVIDEIAIPSSVMDLVNARVADLSEEERDLLDVASCRGFEFEPGLIADATGTPRITCLKRLAQVERKHRLVRASGRAFVFDHHQIQEALHAALPEMLREEYHTAIGNALELSSGAASVPAEDLDGALAVDLCEQFMEGARVARCVRYLPAALTHLEAGHLNAKVGSLAERALAARDPLDDGTRLMLLLRLCRPRGVLDQMGARERQRRSCEEAVHLAASVGSADDRINAAMSVGTYLTRVSDMTAARDELRRALDLAVSGDNRQLEASVAGNLGVALWQSGDGDEAAELFEREIAISREIGFRDGEAAATGNLGLLLAAQGRRGEGQRLKLRALELFREVGDRRGEAVALGNLATLPYLEDRLVDARELYQQHAEVCREIGYRQGEAIAAGNLGNVYIALGQAAEARREYDRLLALSREIGFVPGESLALYSFGTIALEEGDRAEGLSLLREARAVGDPRGYTRTLGATIGLAIGGELLKEGDTPGARAEFTEALRHAEEHGLADLAVRARSELAALPGGDMNAALAQYEETEAELVPGTRRAMRWLLWRATGDRVHLIEAKRLLDESLALVPESDREAMRGRPGSTRDLLDACAEHGL